MSGIWILLLLIMTAALPVIIVFLWYRAKKSPVTVPWFLASIAAGIISLFAAALIQRFFPRATDELWPLFFGVFIRIALIEETSRLITLIPFLMVANHRRTASASFGAALGLASGLGFAMLENAFHGMTDINIALLRVFTAAPLHGACGIRVAAAVFNFHKNIGKSLYYFIFAVIIHGAYNLIIISPALPSALAVIIAIAALFTSISLIKNAGKDDENNYISLSHLP